MKQFKIDTFLIIAILSIAFFIINAIIFKAIMFWIMAAILSFAFIITYILEDEEDELDY